MKTELKRRIEALEAQLASSQLRPRGTVLRFLKPIQNTEEIPAFKQKRLGYRDYRFGADGSLDFCGKGVIRWPMKARTDHE